MRTFNEAQIKKSEIVQLVILHNIYSLKESKDIFFQGGTAIRWCYNGNRFSEDLDFVTHLKNEILNTLIRKVSNPVEKGIIAHFGQGKFEVKIKEKPKASSFVAYFYFTPANERKKISVKIEFESLNKEIYPESVKMIFSMMPKVSSYINTGDFKIPNPNSILLVESKQEILSDKIRALLERPYLKGRDFYDLWFLNTQGISCDLEFVRKKFIMYEAGFKEKRSPHFFIHITVKARKQIEEAIIRDLSRFLSPQQITLFESTGFKDFFDALHSVFDELQDL